MEWLKTFGKKPSKTDRCEIYYKDEWQVVFFENKKRARLVYNGDVRFKSVEYTDEDDLLNLFLHDPVFRASVGSKLYLETSQS